MVPHRAARTGTLPQSTLLGALKVPGQLWVGWMQTLRQHMLTDTQRQPCQHKRLACTSAARAHTYSTHQSYIKFNRVTAAVMHPRE
jgi:hypothetical protein